MFKLVLLILCAWSITSKKQLKQLRLLNVVESLENEAHEIAVGDEIKTLSVKTPSVKKTASNSPLKESPLSEEHFGDFPNYFREHPNSQEVDIGSVGELSLYDEDFSAFREESPVEESAVGGYWDVYKNGRGPAVKCAVGDDKSGWMDRKYTVHMLKLKASCAAECARTANCMAFSWDFSVPMNGRGQCTFKKSFDSRKLITSAGWGSWGTVVVRCPYRPKVDFYGRRTCRVGDYRRGYMPSWATMDIPKLKQECQLECMNSDRCMSFSWNFALQDTQMGVCHFKRWHNGNLVKKLDAWGSVVVRCPPTTTTTAKPGAGGDAPPALEHAVAHTTPLPKATSVREKSESSKTKEGGTFINPKALHVEDPGLESAVGASPLYETEEH